MKHLYMTLLLLGAGMALDAQPNITAAGFNPVAGESIDEYSFDTTGFDPGPAGTAMSWNYPMLSGGSGFTVQVYSALSTPHAPVFASSNVAVSHAALEYDYYLAQVNALEYHGHAGSTSGEISYSDPAKILVYPFSYLDVSVDSFSATHSLEGSPALRKGQVTTTADAYGTLSTPSGTFPNVLRVKSVWLYDDEVETGTGTEITHHEQTWYFWIMEGLHFPLLTYMKEKTVSPSGTVYTNAYGTYVNPESLLTSADENENQVDAFVLYPNPSGGTDVTLWLNTADHTDINLVVFDAGGKQVVSNTLYLSQGENRVQLPTAKLQAGIYFVELAAPDGSGKTLRRLVVQNRP